jgi:hypothetical protein
VIFSIPNGIIEGKLQWHSGLLSKFLGKAGLNTENTDGFGSPATGIANGYFCCICGSAGLKVWSGSRQNTTILLTAV